MGAKRRLNPYVAYDNGIRMGVRTADEWAELFGKPVQYIYNAKSRRSTMDGRYTFRDATMEESQVWREGRSISAFAKTAREAGKSYGQLQAERMAPHIDVSKARGLTSMREREAEQNLATENKSQMGENRVDANDLKRMCEQYRNEMRKLASDNEMLKECIVKMAMQMTGVV